MPPLPRGRGGVWLLLEEYCLKQKFPCSRPTQFSFCRPCCCKRACVNAKTQTLRSGFITCFIGVIYHWIHDLNNVKHVSMLFSRHVFVFNAVRSFVAIDFIIRLNRKAYTYKERARTNGRYAACEQRVDIETRLRIYVIWHGHSYCNYSIVFEFIRIWIANNEGPDQISLVWASAVRDWHEECLLLRCLAMELTLIFSEYGKYW